MERELAFILKEEYSFYQSLYILIDKQKDMVKYEKDDKLLDLYTEVQRCQQRINKSEEKISALKEKNPKYFHLASSAPEIRKLVNSIQDVEDFRHIWLALGLVAAPPTRAESAC